MSTNIPYMLGLILLCGICVSRAADLLNVEIISGKLTKLAEESLSATEIQEHFNSLPFRNLPLDGDLLISNLQKAVNEIFQSSIEGVRNLQNAVKSSLPSMPSDSTQPECCQLNLDDLTYSERFNKDINDKYACERISPIAATNPKRMHDDVIEAMNVNYVHLENIKWQLYGNEDGVTAIYPANVQNHCDIYDNRYRPWYVETKSPNPKHVIIVIDNSGSMVTDYNDKALIEYAKESTITVLNTLNPNDKVSVITFSDDVTLPPGTDGRGCFRTNLAQATPLNIDHLETFVNSVPTAGGTKYKEALNTAFDLLNASRPTDDEKRDQMILFLTDGKPEDDVSGYSEKSEEKEIARNADILRTIITRNRGMNNKVILFTYGLGTEVDMDLLEAMASQNGSAYGVDTSVDIQETVGQAILVDNPENLRSKMASYYDHYANPQIDVPTFSVPHQGASGIGLLTVVSLPVIHNNNFEGIVGIGITLEDLFSDVTYFRQGELSYSFIFEVSSKFVGRTLLHPLLPAPNTVDEDPVFVHITSLERSNEFRTLLNHAIIDGDNFAETTAFVSKRPIARGDSATEGVRVVDEPSQYFCKAVGDGIPYVICVVIADRDKQTKLDAQTPTGSDFMYHRIDISHPDSVCRNGKRKATTDHSTVKFSPNAFIEPKKYASGKETSALVEHYTEYMNDVTEIITSNVLKENIRDTVVATAKIEDIWKEASRSEANQYIAAYFMGTDNGVFRLYPGERLDVHYDHTTRPWYKRVKGNVGKNVLSVPYKDAFGNGYIITLSRTVTVNLNSDQETVNEVRAVMGIDFTLEHFYSLLVTGYPLCMDEKYTCFVMDSSGYLVIHNDFIEANGDINIEHLHITEIEPDIAQDLIIPQGFLSKSKCVNLQTIKQQNYYVATRQSNIDNLDDVNPCRRYQMFNIPNTNVYLGIIDKSKCSDNDETPCACGSKCQFAESTECECPCESDADYDYCDDEFYYTSDSLPTCTPRIPDLNVETQTEDDISCLPLCFPTDCKNRHNSTYCNAAVNCQWFENSFCEESAYPDLDECGSDSSAGVIAGVVVSVIIVLIVAAVIVVFMLVKYRRENSDLTAPNTADVQPSAPPKRDHQPPPEIRLSYVNPYHLDRSQNPRLDGSHTNTGVYSEISERPQSATPSYIEPVDV